MRQLVYRVYHARYQVPFYFWRYKHAWKNNKYYVTDCSKTFHLCFSFKFPNMALFWLNTEKSVRIPIQTAVETFSISIFDL